MSVCTRQSRRGFLAELLSEFRELYPAVDLQITEGRARDTIREVREARLDVAFVVGVPPAGECHSKPAGAMI